MKLRNWQIAYNTAKTIEGEGVSSEILEKEYESVLYLLGSDALGPALTSIWNEVCRNLNELYLIDGNEEKAAFYKGLEKEPNTLTSQDLFDKIPVSKPI